MSHSPRYKYILHGKDQQGLSLIELLVGIALMSIFLLVATSFMSQTQKSYSQLSQKVTIETEAEETSIVLRRYLSQAVNLNFVSLGNVSTGAFSNLNGRLANNINIDTSWTPASVPSAYPVALFFTDDQTSDKQTVPSTDNSRFLPVAIIFQPPNESKYGVLAIEVFRSPAVVSGNITGSNIEHRFTNIVDFKIVNQVFESFSGNNRVISFSVVFTKRFFREPNFTNYRWCPPSKMTLAACSTTMFYTDITKTVDIVVRNNVLGASGIQRVKNWSGSQNSWFDSTAKRPYNGIYFFRPRLPIEALKR